MKKKCTSCAVVKDINEFYAKKNGRHGKHAECKKCCIRRADKWRKNNPEKIRIYEEIKRHRYRCETAQENAEKSKYKSLDSYNNYCRRRMYTAAQTLLNYGVRRGFIIKHDKCMYCGSNDHIEGHHPDYSDPLTVLWLCRSCYAKQHMKVNYGREMDK